MNVTKDRIHAQSSQGVKTRTAVMNARVKRDMRKQHRERAQVMS